jgi:hypothetical protein
MARNRGRKSSDEITVNPSTRIELPMNLDNYVNLDLEPDSPIAMALFEKLKSESSGATIPLTSEQSADGSPSFLTPVMCSWFNSYIQPLRRGALHEIVSLFQRMEIRESGVRGILFEHERDKVTQEKFQRIDGERQMFLSQTGAQHIHSELLKTRQSYAYLTQQHGREAQKLRFWVYWFALLFVIFVLEGIINLESFLKIPGFTPALSIGSFLCVSIALATSAHLLGKTIKQWRDLLGGSVSGTDRRKNHFILGVAAFLLILAMAFVAYARWFLIADVLLRKVQISGGEIGSEEVLQFSGTLFGNFIVYALGVVWSFVQHDSIPGFGEMRRDLEKLQEKENKLIEKYLGSRIRRHINAEQQSLGLLKRREQAQTSQFSEYQSGRRLFDAFREQDVRVISILDSYRTELLAQVRDNDRKAIFAYESLTKLAVDVTTTMSPDEYAGTATELRYL